MRRRIRGWWRAAVVAAAILSPHAAAADPPVDEAPIAATPYAFDPATVAVTTGVSSIDASASDQYSPALAAIVSRTFGERAALYVEPTWVHHSNVQPDTAIAGAPSDTVMVGVGARFRVRPTVSIVTEFSPRLSGFRPGANHGGVAIEKRAGGHMFQLNVSDSFATTMGQIARGGPAGTSWHLGFNISRTFF